MKMRDFRFSIDVPVKNQWSNIERLRSSVQSCLSAVFEDVNGCEALAMATGELLENAVKYGDWASDQGIFRLRVWGNEASGVVSVENPIAPNDEGPKRVMEALAFIDSFPSPGEAYAARLVQVASRPRGSAGGLGLARVAHEGSCVLRAEVDGGVLRVTAELRPERA